MKRLLYTLCLLLTISCSIGKNYPKVVWVDMCESFSIDSVNEALAAQKIPLQFTEDEIIGKLILDKYVFMVSEEVATCISSIAETRDYYMITATDYLIVGFDISFIYDKKHAIMYQTDKYNLIYGPYNILYETCDFNNCTINVQYLDDNSIEKVHFSKCTSDTIDFSLAL